MAVKSRYNINRVEQSRDDQSAQTGLGMTDTKKAERYVLAGRGFATKGALKNEMRDVIFAHLNERLPADHEDAVFLLEVLKHHLRFQEKAADDVVALWCYDSSQLAEFAYSGAQRAKPAIDLERADGSRIDISWVKAVASVPAGGTNPARRATAGTDLELHHRAQVLDAMRQVIEPQIQIFRRRHCEQHGGYVSALSGALASGERPHVDHHAPTFRELAQSWAEQQGGFNSIELTGLEGYGVPRFAESAQRQSWQEYHAQHAVLRILTERENMTRAREDLRIQQSAAVIRTADDVDNRKDA